MTPREAGFLLLTCQFGIPGRKVLTAAQLRTLVLRARTMEMPLEERELTVLDLKQLGCGQELAERIIGLLNETELLEYYVHKGERAGCVPVTRVSPDYPQLLRKRLGINGPGCLWAKGDLTLLGQPGVALVGSRELNGPNRDFAREVGYQAAKQGFALISGNARGADQTAQAACLEAGGSVISIVADALERGRAESRVLYLSEDGFDAPFSSQRALRRNRIIHALGWVTFVAQARLGKGGSWDGTVKNLRFGWSPVFCFDDKSPAAEQLGQMGSERIGMDALKNFVKLYDFAGNLFDQ